MNVNQLVTLYEWNAYLETLERFKKDRKDVEVLFYPAISTLLDKNAPFEQRATFMLVNKPLEKEEPSLFLVADVLDEFGDAYRLERNKKLIKSRNINYLVYHVKKTGEIELNKQLSHFERNVQPFIMKKAFNVAQYEAIMSFSLEDMMVDKEIISIIHEPKLDSLLGLSKDQTNHIFNLVHGEMQKDKERDENKLYEKFFEQTTVDAVFCIGMPNAVPLFGIEYDGKTYHSQKNQKYKDMAKDIAFKKANLPLIRINSEYFRYSSKSKKNAFDNKIIEKKKNINKKISELIISKLLEDFNYIKLISGYLRNEAGKIGEDLQEGHNIRTLLYKMENFIIRRERINAHKIKDLKKGIEIRDLANKYNPDLEQMNQHHEEEEYYKEKEFKWRYGTPIQEEFIENHKGYMWKACLENKGHYKKIGLQESFSSFWYQVREVTDYECSGYLLNDLVKLKIKECLLDDLREKLDDCFTETHREKMKYHDLTCSWRNLENKQKLCWFLSVNGYFDSLGCEFFENARLSRAYQKIHADMKPDLVFRKMVEKITNPLLLVDCEEKESVVEKLGLIHKKLYIEKKAKEIFKDEDFGVFGGMCLLEVFRRIDYAVDMLELIENPKILEDYRSKIKEKDDEVTEEMLKIMKKQD